MLKQLKTHINNLSKIYKGKHIIVYQMGKVGSSSIESSLDVSGVKSIHIHTLYGETVNYLFDYSNTGFSRGMKKALLCFLYRQSFKFGGNVKIISLMREPISRNLSTLFQELPRMLYLESKKDNRSEMDVNEVLDRCMNIYVNQRIPLNWFNDELRKVTGINVFSKKFNRELGFEVYKNRKVELLMLTAEKLNANYDAVANFTGISGGKLINSNTSSKKWYSTLYVEYKNNYNPEPDWINEVYNSQCIKYFYSDADIELFKSKWNV